MSLSKIIDTKAKEIKIQNQFSRGLIILFFRQILAQGMIFLGNIFLSRQLTPNDYGLFSVLLNLYTTLAIFGDFGTNYAIIQKEDEPSKSELKSLFTIQTIFFSSIGIAVILLSSHITAILNADPKAGNIIKFIGILSVTLPFKNIPFSLLERNLRFREIATIEVVNTFLHQSLLVFLIWKGFGVESLIWSLVARSFGDTIATLLVYPWKPGISLDIRSTFSYLKFGISMQWIKILAYIKDYLPTLIIASIMGMASAGSWVWAMSYISIPIYFNRMVDRIVYPAYARLQHDREGIGSVATKALRINFIAGLFILLILILFSSEIVPNLYGETWLGSTTLAIILSINVIGGFVTSAIFPLFYATGHTDVGTKSFFIWTILTGIMSLIGIYLYGLYGMGAGYSTATILISLFLLKKSRHITRINLIISVFYPGLAAILSIALYTAISLLTELWFPKLLLLIIIYVSLNKMVDIVFRGGIPLCRASN